MNVTVPKPLAPSGVKLNPHDLAAGRYGTDDMVRIWGPEQTFAYCLRAQGEAALVLSKLYPAILPPEVADEIASKANLNHISPARIRELEAQTGHDVIAINTALEEVLSGAAKPHVNRFKTSADTTQPARALQLRGALEVIIDSAENLRDIVIEKAMEWRTISHMDCTHGYDALPTVAGRPFAHYAEMLQSDLDWLALVYSRSVMGKWGDATGNHHAAASAGVNGAALEEEYCRKLGINHMLASAQVPGLEFELDMVFALARTGETLNNLARYIAWGRSDDVNIFFNSQIKKQKGSSAMPHKDAKNGNPDIEEQVMSIRNDLHGWMATALSNCELPYARNLAASANSRIRFEDGFKFLDHGIRRLAYRMCYTGINQERSKERVLRSHGVVTSAQVMTYLTDQRLVPDPLPRSQAHDLVAECATEAYKRKVPFVDVLRTRAEITARIDDQKLQELTDPLQYVGQSKEIVEAVAEKCYQKKTL